MTVDYSWLNNSPEIKGENVEIGKGRNAPPIPYRDTFTDDQYLEKYGHTREWDTAKSDADMKTATADMVRNNANSDRQFNRLRNVTLAAIGGGALSSSGLLGGGSVGAANGGSSIAALTPEAVHAGGVATATGMANGGVAALNSLGAVGGTSAFGGSSLYDNVKQVKNLYDTGKSLLGGGNTRGGGNMANGTSTTSSQIDPRMQNILYGQNGQGGYLDKLQTAGNTGINGGLNAAGQNADSYLRWHSGQDMENMSTAANGLMNSNIQSPTMQAASANSTGMNAANAQSVGAQNTNMSAANLGMASQMGAAKVNAPNQNSLDLKGSYDDMINGEAGNNPYLTGAIQKGINQSNTAFQNMQTDATRNLTENVLGNIRGGAVASGQYGGSRQGVAEGKAVNDFSTQMGRAMSQYGQNNTDSAIAAQAGAYDQDRNRSLNAMNNLSGQQYGVASQNASMQQQANATNAGANNQFAMQNNANQQNANQFNAASANQNSQFNANATNQNNQYNASNNQAANQFNANATNQNNQYNASNQQSANAANLGMQGQTNNLNSNNQQAGIGLQSNLLNQAGQNANNYNNYDLNRQLAVGSGLSPFTGLNRTENTSSAPGSQNTAGNWIGGAAVAGGLLNSLPNGTFSNIGNTIGGWFK
jgi:hypothetical protein